MYREDQNRRRQDGEHRPRSPWEGEFKYEVAGHHKTPIRPPLGVWRRALYSHEMEAQAILFGC